MGIVKRSFTTNRRLVKDLLVRDLKGRYVGSTMGFFWSLVFPAVNLVVYMFVFRFVLKARWSDKMGPYEVGLVMLVGIVVWQSFAEGIARMTNTLVENRNLIQKVVFPAEVLPIHLTLSSLTNMLIGIAIAMLATAYGMMTDADAVQYASLQVVAPPPMRPLAFGLPLLCVPLLVVLQAMFMLGVGSFLAAFNLLVRDTHHVISVFLMVWMFGTPIVYPPYSVQITKFSWILQVNPMHWLVDSYRDVLLYASWPSWQHVAGFAAVAVVVLFIGLKFFEAQKPRFPDLL